MGEEEQVFCARPVSAPEMHPYPKSLTCSVFSCIFLGRGNVSVDPQSRHIWFSVEYWTVKFIISSSDKSLGK